MDGWRRHEAYNSRNKRSHPDAGIETRVIVAVEGPSAAGKTTWCRSHYPNQTVWEAPVAPNAPDRRLDPTGAEEYWAAQNSKRWLKALELERESGIAICDTDAFKLHYAWCLRQLGLITEEYWLHALRLHRKLFATGAVGIADLILVSLPHAEDLRRQKANDPTRPRRAFELHLRFIPPLTEWYRAISALEPDRVQWSLPPGRLAAKLTRLGPRSERTGVRLFDEVVRALPWAETRKRPES